MSQGNQLKQQQPLQFIPNQPPFIASLDLQSQQTQQNNQVIDQMSALFEMFANYFDRRFFELQEFIYHYNKAVLMTNKNFNNIQLSVAKNIALDTLQPFKQRKDEKRLSEELRDHIKKIYDLKSSTEELIRSSTSPQSNPALNVKQQNFINNPSNKTSQSTNITKTPTKISQYTSSGGTSGIQTTRSQQQLVKDSKNIEVLSDSPPPALVSAANKITTIVNENSDPTELSLINHIVMSSGSSQKNHNSTGNINSHNSGSKENTHLFRKKTANNNQATILTAKEESEVQDDSDTELKRQIFMGNLVPVQLHPRPQTMLTTIGDDNQSEGESVLIGDEESPIMFTEPANTKLESTLLKKRIGNRSPQNTKASTHSSKIQQHNKHKASKPTLTKDNQQSRSKTRATFETTTGNATLKEGLEEVIGDQIMNQTMKHSNETQKSPFTYNKSSKISKYNQLNSQKQQTQSNSSQQFNQTQRTVSSNKSTTKPSRNNNASTLPNSQRQKSRSPVGGHGSSSQHNTSQSNHSSSWIDPSTLSQPSSQVVITNSKSVNVANFQSSRNFAPQQHNSLTETSQTNSQKQLSNFQSAQNIQKLTKNNEALQILDSSRADQQHQQQILVSSSGGSSSKQHLESIQPMKQQKGQPLSSSSPVIVNTRYSSKPDILTQQSPQISNKSSIVAEDDEKLVQKFIRNMDVSDQRSIFEIGLLSSKNLENDNSLEKLLASQENMDVVMLGETGGQHSTAMQLLNQHRFTLSGEKKGLAEEENEFKQDSQRQSSVFMIDNQLNSNRRSQASNKNEFTVEYVENMLRQSNAYQKALNNQLEIQPPYNFNDNIFSPTAQLPDFDLSQYNSPSFAAGHHISSQNYHSKGNLAFPSHQPTVNNRLTQSSNGSAGVDLPLQFEQKIVMHNSVRQKTQRTAFLKLPGEVLQLIGDYLNEKLPIFIFTNRISFKISLQFQIEYYERQRQIMFLQVQQIQRELEQMQNARRFDLSPQSREEFDSIRMEEWNDLILNCRIKPTSLKQKDIIILRLYLTFMGLDIAEEVDDARFLEECSQFMKDCDKQIAEVLDPEKSFIISDENKKRIKELLVNLQREKLLEDESRSLENSINNSLMTGGQRVLETFTNLLFEALQFVNIIPNVLVQDMRSEMEELKKVADAFNGIKNNLIDFKNLVA